MVVLRDTTILLARGYGYADLDKRTPVTPETPFNIASVSKPISAVVAMRLVEKGLLDLDRTMARYDGFAEFCTEARAAGGLFFDDYLCADSTLTLRHVLGMTANGTKPGSRFFYNPVSYSWASRPMMEVTGQPFSTLVAELVFQPAGMNRSARQHRKLPLPPDIAGSLARPYHGDSTGTFVPSEPLRPQGDGAAGGVISTALDLARFDQALSRGTLISPTSRELMWTPAQSPGGEEIPYGIGWFVQEYGGERWVWHTGLWEGAYSALYFKVPGRGLTLILLANSDGLSWDNRLDEARADRSPFVQMFLEEFPK
jgi:CubicO group peptidase (beta-lactamase class C family)